MNWHFDMWNDAHARIKALREDVDPRTGMPRFLIRTSTLGSPLGSFPGQVPPSAATNPLPAAWLPLQSP